MLILSKQVPYVNVRDLGNISNQMFYDHHFKQEIYNNTSGVHIPIEIYEGCKSTFLSKFSLHKSICPKKSSFMQK